MFKYGVTYRIPKGTRVRMCRPLEEIGVTEARFFGSFAAGEQFYATDKDGNEVSFLVDDGTPAWVPVLNLNPNHTTMWEELAQLWGRDKDATARKFVEVAAARFVPVEEGLTLCLQRAKKDAGIED